MKLTEDEVVTLLSRHLKGQGWIIENYKLGRDRGIDIEAMKGRTRLLVEAKGARAGDHVANKVREVFDCGQIKSHFGRAIVKLLSLKNSNPTAKLAIAHPDDPDIRKHIGALIPHLKALDVVHFWVAADGSVKTK